MKLNYLLQDYLKLNEGRLSLSCLTALLVLLVGCTTASTASLSDGVAGEASAWRSSNYLAESVGENSQDKIWQVPAPEKRTTVKETTVKMEAENGTKLDVAVTIFSPASGYIFTQEQPDPNEKNRFDADPLELKLAQELKLNNKVFGYVIFAKRLQLGQAAGEGNQDNKMFVYRIYDTDGDGRFETRLTDSTKIPVPAWATS